MTTATSNRKNNQSRAIKPSREIADIHAKRCNLSEPGEPRTTVHRNIPGHISLVEPQRILMIFTPAARDYLIATGHFHVITAIKNGFEYYMFANTWELQADLVNYFDAGMDYDERGMM